MDKEKRYIYNKIKQVDNEIKLPQKLNRANMIKLLVDTGEDISDSISTPMYTADLDSRQTNIESTYKDMSQTVKESNKYNFGDVLKNNESFKNELDIDAVKFTNQEIEQHEKEIEKRISYKKKIPNSIREMYKQPKNKNAELKRNNKIYDEKSMAIIEEIERNKKESIEQIMEVEKLIKESEIKSAQKVAAVAKAQKEVTEKFTEISRIDNENKNKLERDNKEIIAYNEQKIIKEYNLGEVAKKLSSSEPIDTQSLIDNKDTVDTIKSEETSKKQIKEYDFGNQEDIIEINKKDETNEIKSKNIDDEKEKTDKIPLIIYNSDENKVLEKPPIENMMARLYTATQDSSANIEKIPLIIYPVDGEEIILKKKLDTDVENIKIFEKLENDIKKEVAQNKEIKFTDIPPIETKQEDETNNKNKYVKSMYMSTGLGLENNFPDNKQKPLENIQIISDKTKNEKNNLTNIIEDMNKKKVNKNKKSLMHPRNIGIAAMITLCIGTGGIYIASNIGANNTLEKAGDELQISENLDGGAEKVYSAPIREASIESDEKEADVDIETDDIEKAEKTEEESEVIVEEPEEAISEPEEAISEPEEVIPEPEEAISEPEEAISEPVISENPVKISQNSLVRDDQPIYDLPTNFVYEDSYYVGESFVVQGKKTLLIADKNNEILSIDTTGIFMDTIITEDKITSLMLQNDKIIINDINVEKNINENEYTINIIENITGDNIFVAKDNLALIYKNFINIYDMKGVVQKQIHLASDETVLSIVENEGIITVTTSHGNVVTYKN